MRCAVFFLVLLDTLETVHALRTLACRAVLDCEPRGEEEKTWTSSHAAAVFFCRGVGYTRVRPHAEEGLGTEIF